MSSPSILNQRRLPDGCTLPDARAAGCRGVRTCPTAADLTVVIAAYERVDSLDRAPAAVALWDCGRSGLHSSPSWIQTRRHYSGWRATVATRLSRWSPRWSAVVPGHHVHGGSSGMTRTTLRSPWATAQVRYAPGAVPAWLPSACLVGRVALLGSGFTTDMRVGADVGLIWRLTDLGHVVR